MTNQYRIQQSISFVDVQFFKREKRKTSAYVLEKKEREDLFFLSYSGRMIYTLLSSH
jgi:hypothetical protein